MVQGSLSSGNQQQLNQMWEWRGYAVWMPGALQSFDLRIRAKISIPPILGDNIDFDTTYVPVLDCVDAVVDNMLLRYAKRFAPENVPNAQQASDASIFELQRQINRTLQRKEASRQEYGQEAVGSFAAAFSDL